MKQAAILGLILLLCGCKSPLSLEDQLLQSDVPELKRIFDNLPAHELQFMFTEVNQMAGDSVPVFIDHTFQVEDSTYFYPASTVKFPIAIFALEKMYAEKKMQRDTPFYMEGDSVETTMAKEIEKIFTVSDNEAYNRLFDYLGQDYINQRFKTLGLPARIFHRLSVEDAENITTKPYIYYLNDSTIRNSSPIVNQPLASLQLRELRKGIGYYEDGALIEAPKDFSRKNYLPLRSLHELMKRLFFPNAVAAKERFKMEASDRTFLMACLKKLPREAGYAVADYPDSYVKFLLVGDLQGELPSHLEIYNKVGYAYGYLTDCAYVLDTERNKSYIISATLHVNENKIFNDDHYEYKELGIPFLAELGRQLIGE